MTKRRDLFIMAPAPGKAAEAEKALSSWLREIDGHPGYLGGAVLKECAGELLPDTMVLALEFESTAAARAFWPTIEGPGQPNPIYPDDRSRTSPDQGGVLFDPGTDRTDEASPSGTPLRHDRGGGLFARLLHVHAEVADEFASTSTVPG